MNPDRPLRAAPPSLLEPRSGYTAGIVKADWIAWAYWQKRSLAPVTHPRFLAITRYAANIWNEYLPFLIGLVLAH
jgi:hypothetical protein